MLRRLCTLLLVLACALAPALPALEQTAKAADDCCCGTGHCCGQPDCAPPAPAPTMSALPAATAETRQVAARPAPGAKALRVFDFSGRNFVRQSRVVATRAAIVVLPGAPLFRAHCALLI